jgi:glutaredoxin 3
MPLVEIYSTDTCPYCIRAKKLLTNKGVSFTTYDVNRTGRDEMIKRANGRTTVPQIFIDGRHVGGCDDLFALDAEDKLDPMLAGATAS